MRINKTIASKREEVILESTRIKEEKRRKRKKVMRFVGLSTALALGTAGLSGWREKDGSETDGGEFDFECRNRG